LHFPPIKQAFHLASVLPSRSARIEISPSVGSTLPYLCNFAGSTVLAGGRQHH